MNINDDNGVKITFPTYTSIKNRYKKASMKWNSILNLSNGSNPTYIDVWTGGKRSYCIKDSKIPDSDKDTMYKEYSGLEGEIDENGIFEESDVIHTLGTENSIRRNIKKLNTSVAKYFDYNNYAKDQTYTETYIYSFQVVIKYYDTNLDVLEEKIGWTNIYETADYNTYFNVYIDKDLTEILIENTTIEFNNDRFKSKIFWTGEIYYKTRERKIAGEVINTTLTKYASPKNMTSNDSEGLKVSCSELGDDTYLLFNDEDRKLAFMRWLYHGAVPIYIYFTVSEPICLTDYMMRSDNRPDDWEAPTMWDVQGYNEYKAIWETIDSRSGIEWTANNQAKYFYLDYNLDNTYTQFRFVLKESRTGTNGKHGTELGSITFNGYIVNRTYNYDNAGPLLIGTAIDNISDDYDIKKYSETTLNSEDVFNGNELRTYPSQTAQPIYENAIPNNGLIINGDDVFLSDDNKYVYVKYISDDDLKEGDEVYVSIKKKQKEQVIIHTTVNGEYSNLRGSTYISPSGDYVLGLYLRKINYNTNTLSNEYGTFVGTSSDRYSLGFYPYYEGNAVYKLCSGSYTTRIDEIYRWQGVNPDVGDGANWKYVLYGQYVGDGYVVLGSQTGTGTYIYKIDTTTGERLYGTYVMKDGNWVAPVRFGNRVYNAYGYGNNCYFDFIDDGSSITCTTGQYESDSSIGVREVYGKTNDDKYILGYYDNYFVILRHKDKSLTHVDIATEFPALQKIVNKPIISGGCTWNSDTQILTFMSRDSTVYGIFKYVDGTFTEIPFNIPDNVLEYMLTDNTSSNCYTQFSVSSDLSKKLIITGRGGYKYDLFIIQSKYSLSASITPSDDNIYYGIIETLNGENVVKIERDLPDPSKSTFKGVYTFDVDTPMRLNPEELIRQTDYKQLDDILAKIENCLSLKNDWYDSAGRCQLSCQVACQNNCQINCQGCNTRQHHCKHIL
jgi:hypothetical protein